MVLRLLLILFASCAYGQEDGRTAGARAARALLVGDAADSPVTADRSQNISQPS